MEPTTGIAAAIDALGVTPATLSDQQRRRLDEDGFLALPGLMPAELLEAFRRRTTKLLEREGAAAGHETPQSGGVKALANLINKGEMFERCLVEPAVLAAAHQVLGDFRVNSLNFRASLPGEGHRPLHVDWAGAVRPGDYHICNSMWMLDDFTAANGATGGPGSHRWGKASAELLDDPLQPHPDEVVLTAPAGSVVIFNSHVWHGGTLNTTGSPRRGMTMSYCRRDEPQQLDQAAHVLKRVTTGCRRPRGTSSMSSEIVGGAARHRLRPVVP